MENIQSRDRKPLINELTQGRDLVKQLNVHLDRSTSTAAEFLITKILSSFDKAISMVSIWDKSKEVDQPDHHQIKGSTVAMKEAKTSSVICESPQSHCNPKDDQIIRESYKKRKRQPQWTEKVYVGLDTGFIGAPDDGYDWRKYGQKDILRAKYPRSYYRCSSRKIQGCVAIKQVQRSNEDPSMFSITYEGRHTCIQISDHADQQLVANQQYQNDQNQDLISEYKKQKRPQEMVLNFQTGSQVQTKEPHEAHESITTSSFSLFPSTSSPINHFENENDIISSLTLDRNDNVMDISSPPYMSPIESESNFSSASHLQILDLLVFSQDPADFSSSFPFGYSL